MRNLLIRLAIQYKGDFFKIKKAIQNKETADMNLPLQKAITILDKEYPKSLLELKNPPFVLFYQGNINLLSKPTIAIVGSRNATEYGMNITREIVESLRDDYVIVSGLAKGIDAASHISAKETIGVIGNGIDIHYPYCNDRLYEYMKSKQLIISEYPLNTKPERYHFPFRNRIIAALADKLIVTEAKIHSGTMLTVNEALALNKEIYAVSYRYDDENGTGCNLLIEQGAFILTKENIGCLFDK